MYTHTHTMLISYFLFINHVCKLQLYRDTTHLEFTLNSKWTRHTHAHTHSHKKAPKYTLIHALKYTQTHSHNCPRTCQTHMPWTNPTSDMRTHKLTCTHTQAYMHTHRLPACVHTHIASCSPQTVSQTSTQMGKLGNCLWRWIIVFFIPLLFFSILNGSFLCQLWAAHCKPKPFKSQTNTTWRFLCGHGNGEGAPQSHDLKWKSHRGRGAAVHAVTPQVRRRSQHLFA